MGNIDSFLNDTVLKKYKSKIGNRLDEYHYLLTEDCIRYDLFDVLRNEKEVDSESIILEASFDDIEKVGKVKIPQILKNTGRADTFIPMSKSNYFFEFKYHRNKQNDDNNSSVNNRPRTAQFGSLLDDIVRLSVLEKEIQKAQCYFVWLTDVVMFEKYSPQNKEAEEIMNKLRGKSNDNSLKSTELSKEILPNKAYEKIGQNFKEKGGKLLLENKSITLHSRLEENTLGEDHHLFIWKIDVK